VYGGAWLAGDSSKRNFVDQIDPSALHVGANEIGLCLPDATRGVAISNLRIVGELDRGTNLVTTGAIGTETAPALIDRDPETSVPVAAGDRVSLAFDRLIAPDALVVATGEAVAGDVDCIDRQGTTTRLTTKHHSSPDGVFKLEGGTNRCAEIFFTATEPATISEVNVVGSGAAEPVDWPRVVVTSAAEHFGERAWVGGFVARPPAMPGAIRIDVAGQMADTMTGDFGRLLGPRTDVAAAWPVSIGVRFPDGNAISKQLLLDRGVHALLTAPPAAQQISSPSATTPSSPFGNEGDSVVGLAKKLDATSIRLGTKVGVDVPIGAVAQPTKITVRHLGEDVLPPLDPGMINVTAPKHRGYELLPHGQHFAKPVEIILPYDPSLLPEGMTFDDIHAYFYDPHAKRWTQFERAAIDVGERVTRSKSLHFTIAINAVLTTPKNAAPLSFDPTTLTSIPAASPTANMDFVEAPQPTSTGDARLSLPIRVPAGRGYTPSLAISYSSSTTNGWAGVGWDIQTSHIEIDTRWGVPTYAATERPRYLLDGAELVPTLETDGPGCTAGPFAGRFRPRVEGAFAYIVRCGTSASDYHWEVRDRDGTLMTYGTGGAALASYYGVHGIFRWNLAEVVDVHNNKATFQYETDDITNTAEPARELYLAAIFYTSHPDKPEAPYTIFFERDDGNRPDRIVSGRAGFKMVTRHLLRAIRVKFRADTIRDYVLTYAHGQFDKSVLASVRVYGTAGCNPHLDAFTPPTNCADSALFHEHRFEYYTEPEVFAPAVEWSVHDDPAPDLAALSKGHSENFSGEIGGSYGAAGLKGKAGVTGAYGTRDELVGLYDMNNDGLVDQVFDTGDSLKVLYNQTRPGITPASPLFAATPPQRALIDALGAEEHLDWGVETGGQLYVLEGSIGFQSSVTRAKKFLTDLDGDGFIDVIKGDGEALFGAPCNPGLCFSPAPFGAITDIDPRLDPALNALEGSIRERLVNGDPVIQWIAPFSGKIAIAGTVQKPNAGGSDGVTVEAYHDDEIIGAALIIPAVTIPLDFPEPQTRDVEAGEAIYVRVKTGHDDGIASDGTLNDKVDVTLDVKYTEVCLGLVCGSGALADPERWRDPTNRPIFAYSSSADFRVAGSPAPLVASATGRLVLLAKLVKTVSEADVRVCVQRFTPASTDLTLDRPCSSSGPDVENVSGTTTLAATSETTTPLALPIDVLAGQFVIVRVESDLSFDPRHITFEPLIAETPLIAYSRVCVPNVSGGGMTCSTDPDVIKSVPLLTQTFGPFIVVPDQLPAVPFVSTRTDTLSVGTLLVPDSVPAPDGPYVFAIRSNRSDGVRFIRDCVTATCFGAIAVPPLSVVEGESLTFEIVSDGFFGNSILTLRYSSGTITSVELVKRPLTPEPMQSRFAGGYRRWHAVFWNEEESFKPTQLIDDLRNPEHLLQARVDQIARTLFPAQPSFGGSVISGGAPAWIAPASAAYVSATTLHAAPVGMLFGNQTPGGPSSPGDLAGLYAKNYARQSTTNSFYISQGVLLPIGGFSFSINASASETKTTTDAIDMTGDGIADVVAPHDVIVGALGTSEGVHLAGFDVQNELRYRSSHQYGIGFGDSAVLPHTTSSGRTIAVDNPDGPDRGPLGFSTGVGIGIGRSATKKDLVDINGDGLPDLVRRDFGTVKVQYNLGDRFGAEEPFGGVDGELRASIDDFEKDVELPLSLDGTNSLSHETTITQTLSGGFKIFDYVDVSHSETRSATRVTRQLADINGDGLPDLLVKLDGENFVRVQLNRGGDFAPHRLHGSPTRWGTTPWPVQLSQLFDDEVNSKLGQLGVTGPDVLGGTGSQNSSSTSVSVEIPIYAGWNANGGLAFSESTDTYEMSLVDVDGDGSADHVLRRQRDGDDGTVWVKHNVVTGKANLLRVVSRPLGGTITLDYQRAGNTVEMPTSRQVLSRVIVDDLVDLGALFSSPNVDTSFAYEGGVFSHNEKEFFGFGKVTTTRADGVTIEQQYESSSYAVHGMLRSETRRDRKNQPLQHHVITRSVTTVLDENSLPVAVHPDCVEHLHPLLARNALDGCTSTFAVVVRDEEMRSEGGSTQKTRTIVDGPHDRFGNVLASLDSGDAAIPTDNTYATAQYRNDTSRWILGRVTALAVDAGAGGTRLRSRTGNYDDSGELIALNIDTGSGIATTRLRYDAFGNLEHITTPPNEKGDTQTFDVTFDELTATYPIKTTDGFGHTSHASYDLRFGIATSETDLHGVELKRTYDPFGRLQTVTGPYDPPNVPGLVVQYLTDAPQLPRAVTTTRAAAPPDYTGPIPGEIKTVTITDRLGQAIEVRKKAVVNGVEGMVTGSVVARDEVGRVIRTQNPFFTEGISDAFVEPRVTPETTTTYDDLDRPVLTRYADGATETMIFAIQTAPNNGPLLFMTRAIDANGRLRETYADHTGRTRAFVEHPTENASSITTYDYFATGELSEITDAEGNQTRLTYDRRGFRTSLDNPDTGLIEDRFDLMGNRVASIEPNHRALGVQVHYIFDLDRLKTIDYPSKPDVTFTYGKPAAAAVDFQAGRIIRVDDESGYQVHTYGALGEIRKTIRTVLPDKQGSQPIVFDLRLVSDSLGRQLRVRYPDGVTVTNRYDAGGMLESVEGAGSGWQRSYASQIRYDEFGHRTHLLFGNGIESTWSFDPKRVRLEAIKTKPTTTGPMLQDLRYSYDAGGNPKKIENALAPLANGSVTLPGKSTVDLTYDGVDRLLTATGNAQLSAQKTTTYLQTFAYSPSHNLLQKQRDHLIYQPGSIPTAPTATNFASSYTYAVRPHLPSKIGDLLVTYDPSGNPTRRRTEQTATEDLLVWDDDNRLVDFTSGGVHQHNTYDSTGNRVRRKSTQSETLFSSQYFDLENGTQGVKHVFAGPLRAASELGRFASGEDQLPPDKRGVAYFFHKDHLQSTTVLTDDSGAVHESLEYFPDGEMWIDRGPLKPVNRYLFSGKPFDPDTGFYDFGQRFYEPRTSLWLGVDPVLTDSMSKSIGRPSLLAPLAYAAHSPIRFIDPNGRDVSIEEQANSVCYGDASCSGGNVDWKPNSIGELEEHLSSENMFQSPEEQVFFAHAVASSRLAAQGRSTTAYYEDQDSWAVEALYNPGWQKVAKVILVAATLASPLLARAAPELAAAEGLAARGLPARGLAAEGTVAAEADPLLEFAAANRTPNSRFASEYTSPSGAKYYAVNQPGGRVNPFDHHGGCSEIGSVLEAHEVEGPITGGWIRTIHNRPPNTTIPPGPPRGQGAPAVPCRACQRVLNGLRIPWQ